MMHAFKIIQLLRPFGWLYGLFTGIRNRMFDSGMLRSSAFRIPVISIGNITVGGTGKTPHTEYTASLLKDRYRTAVLSRGYGRSTKGYILSDARSDSSQIGDEPIQIKRRFPDLDVAVCEDRSTGIKLLTEQCAPQVIILDDAFQHRKVTPSLNILLVNWHRNILDDAMMPAGRLRESAKGRRRAHMIIVTKCPDDLSLETMERMAGELRTRPEQQVLFSTLQYGTPYLMDNPLEPVEMTPGPVLAITGIASPSLMTDELERQGHKVTLMDFPDHHRFSQADLKKIASTLLGMGHESVIVTTAKDAARLADMDIDPALRSRIFVLPVNVRFLGDDVRIFDHTVEEHVKSFWNK